MLENFDAIKKQLSELAGSINAFKSEAVQLRIVELIFEKAGVSTPEERETAPKHDSKARSRKRRKQTTAPIPEGKKARGGGGTGAVAMLLKVHQAGFFKEPKIIGNILEHCETNLARKIKANEISGKLGRMVRNGELKRTKNSDGQYEYRNP